jgi:hypothetical protein
MHTPLYVIGVCYLFTLGSGIRKREYELREVVNGVKQVPGVRGRSICRGSAHWRVFGSWQEQQERIG